MRLVLSVATKILDSIELNPKQAKDNDYIQSLCRLLLIKHELTIIAMQQEPTFYIEVSSKPEQQTYN